MQQFECNCEQKQECIGYDLFRYCHELAGQYRHRFAGQPLLPSGARIFYYTRRLLLAHGTLPEVNPDAAVLPAHVVERFLEAAPVLAERLVSEFPRAVRVRAALEPRSQRLLVPEPVVLDPLKRPWEAGYPCGSQRGGVQLEERLRESCSGAADQKPLVRLLTLLQPDRLPVAPVARPGDTPHIALRLLRARLKEDTERGWHIPLAGAYLYNEPLELWFLRSLVEGGSARSE